MALQIERKSERISNNEHKIQFSATVAISNFIKSRKTCSKIIWIIFLWTVFTGMVIHLASVVNSYCKFIYSENIIFKQNHIFPDITFKGGI